MSQEGYSQAREMLALGRHELPATSLHRVHTLYGLLCHVAKCDFMPRDPGR